MSHTSDMASPQTSTEGAAGATGIGRAHAWIAQRAAWLLPLLVVVIGGLPTFWGIRAQTFATLGRDQGIFQYVAWAIRNGDRTYRDIHEINGPLPHAWHMVMQALGGEDEHMFRSIDTALLLVVYVFAAAMLPRWVDLDLGAAKTRTRTKHLVLWILAGLTLMGSQYIRYDWWHTSQREAFYSLLLLASLSFQTIVHTTKSAGRARLALLFAALTTTLTWFGKPPCAVFSVLQALVFLFDRKNIVISLRSAFAIVLVAAISVTTSMLLFVFVYEDFSRGIELLAKVPKLHHTIWNETLLGSYRAFNNGPKLDWAFATFVGFLAAYRLLRLPRRALLACILPVGGILVFAGQGKAFPYHLHMVTLGTAMEQVIVFAALARWMQIAPIPRTNVQSIKDRVREWLPLLAAGGAIFFGLKCTQDSLLSPAVRHGWASAGSTAEKRTTHAYFDEFPWGDYFPNDLRTTAAYLQFHTRPDERIQLYGFDPYLLFLARRKSASPVIYSFELNVDAALKGGPGAKPTPELKDWLSDYARDAESLVLSVAEQAPPAAFVLFDRAPWTFPDDSERDFQEHCPKLHHFMQERYVPAAIFGTVRVWLRRDVAARQVP